MISSWGTSKNFNTKPLYLSSTPRRTDKGVFNFKIFNMDFLEKDLEDIIFNTDNGILQERGLYIEGKKYRQLCIGNYGIADIVTIQRIPSMNKIFITVYELKKGTIGKDAFLQAVGYVKGILSYLEMRKSTFQIETKIILVGRDIERNTNFCFINTFVSDYKLENYTYKYDIDGLTFDWKNDYSLINEGFKNKLK